LDPKHHSKNKNTNKTTKEGRREGKKEGRKKAKKEGRMNKPMVPWVLSLSLLCCALPSPMWER
jgi:flagellar biosynthesis/type III secretory pathway protein FliH